MNRKPRRYYHSSSFKMALLFTVLLVICAGILTYLIVATGGEITWLAITVIILMLVVIGASFFISVFVVNRINTIARTARDIMDTGDLSQRIVIDAKWDDLSYLAVTLNALLDRIEQLMQGIREVSDNIAHDLRTPLTRLRGRLESLHEDPRLQKEPDIAKTAEQMVEEADHLLGIFQALLRISSIGKGQRHAPFAPFPLDVLLADVIELYEPLAEEKQIEIQVHSAPTPCYGDRDLIFQTLANLLDNAVKFTPQKGRIDIRCEQEEKLCLLTLCDNGPGIPAEEHARVFDRFYRTESSRHTPGSGLGLSLVAAVIEMHKGAITLSDNHPGLCIRLTLPAKMTKK